MSEYFEAEKKRMVRIDGENFKLVPQTSKSFEEGKKQGAIDCLVELDKVDKRLLATADYLKNKIKDLEKEKGAK